MPKAIADILTRQAAAQEINALALGINLATCFDQAAQQIASKLITKYSPGSEYTLVCSLSGNSLLGMYLALELYRLRASQVQVCLIGRASELNGDLATDVWQKLKVAGVKLQQDCFDKDIPNSKVIVECLGGLHLPDKLFKRSRDVVARISHFKTNTVSLDFPAAGYTPRLRFALDYPKHADDIVVSSGLAAQIQQFAGPGEAALLFKPRRDSYKQDNGKLLIVDQEDDLLEPKSSQYVQTASEYAGTVFYFNPNLAAASTQQAKLSSFGRLVELNPATLAAGLEQVDVVLITSSVQNNLPNQALITKLLQDYPDKRYIFESNASSLVRPQQMGVNGNIAFILAGGSGVYRFMSDISTKSHPGSSASASGQLKRIATEYNCYFRVSGLPDQVYGRNLFSSQVEMRQIIGKPTGDPKLLTQIAARTAAYATKNDLWLALCAA